MTRHEVIEMASIACLKELYSKVQPAVDWDDFMEENRLYSKAYKQWESLHRESPEKAGSVLDFCGPRPYEFYYLPKDVMKEIADSYVKAYNIDAHQELLDIIDILKNYCKAPIVDAWITESDGQERRGYHHPDPLKEDIATLLRGYVEQEDFDAVTVAEEVVENFYEFLDMAGQFYSWNSDLNAFNTTVYLGPSPCSNKETVIKNWKQYRNQDIKIDESIYIEDEED